MQGVFIKQVIQVVLEMQFVILVMQVVIQVMQVVKQVIQVFIISHTSFIVCFYRHKSLIWINLAAVKEVILNDLN